MTDDDSAVTDETPDVVVLRKGTHGMPVSEYVAELRDRLPDHDVRHAETPGEERELVADAPVVTGMEIDEDVLDHADEMELFACAYAGTDHLPMDALEARGVAVTNASGVHGPNMGEHVVGNLLVFARRLHEGWRRQQNRQWRHFRSRELQGSTVTIVGLGAIGQSVVERLEGFGVDTIGVRYTPEKGGPTDEVVGFDSDERTSSNSRTQSDSGAFDDALARTDYLVLACPLTETTRGLIGEAELKTLPPEAVIVNVARGPVVDTDALVWALRKQHIRGAALDVTDPEPLPESHPLWNLENCLITPHCSGHTPEYYSRFADIVAENVKRLEEGEELVNRVV